ncbi:MAG: isoprenyl transferase [Planctomycetota bacterium]|nr:MAG: isoprenyl transferase [Planctomycetota bacterium]
MSPPTTFSIDEARARAGLNPQLLPRHVAVIMDGNGRWARARSLLRINGHRRGVEAVRQTVTECATLGIEWLTLYAFSTENWQRPKREVNLLMDLLAEFLVEERPTLLDNGIRLQAIGQIWRLPPHVRSLLEETIACCRGGSGMTLTLALSYGGRDEICAAMRAIAEQVRRGELSPESIDEKLVQEHLYTAAMPDVDVVIRSAGEQRLSNFLPWQCVYAEFVSIPECWPDVRIEHLHAALREFQGRHRRFGQVR